MIFVLNKYFKIQNFNFLHRFIVSKSNNLQVIPIIFSLFFSFICMTRNLKKKKKKQKKKKLVKQPSAARFATTFTAWIRTSASSASSKDKIFCNPTAKIFILLGRNKSKIDTTIYYKMQVKSSNTSIYYILIIPTLLKQLGYWGLLSISRSLLLLLLLLNLSSERIRTTCFFFKSTSVKVSSCLWVKCQLDQPNAIPSQDHIWRFTSSAHNDKKKAMNKKIDLPIFAPNVFHLVTFIL